MKQSTKPAPLTAMVFARAPYALLVSGDALAPRYRDGEAVVIDPDAQPAAGDAVLALCPGVGALPAAPRLLNINADGDLTAPRLTFAAGSYLLLGVVTGKAAPEELTAPAAPA